MNFTIDIVVAGPFEKIRTFYLMKVVSLTSRSITT